MAATTDRRPPAVLARPGPAEMGVYAILLFLLAFSMPQNWFEVPPSPIDAIRDAADPASSAGSSLSVVILLGLFLAAASRVLSNVGLVVRAMRIEPLLVSLVGLAMASVVWSADPELTTRRVVSLALSTLFGYVLVIRLPIREIVRLTAVVLLAGLVLNIVWCLALPEYGVGGGGRWTGVLASKNALGRVTALSVMIFVLVARDKRRHRALWWSAAVVGAVVVVLSTSKSALSIMVVLSILGLVFVGFRARRTLFGAVAVALVAAIGVMLAFVTNNLAYFTGLLDKDVSFTGRTELWSDSWQAFLERPVLGHGFDAFWNGWYSPAHEIWVANDWLPPNAHNVVLDMLLQLGIVGSVLYGAVLFRAAVRGARYIRIDRSAIGLFPLMMTTFMLLYSLSESSFESRTIIWPLFVVAVTASGAALERSGSIRGLSPADHDAAARS